MIICVQRHRGGCFKREKVSTLQGSPVGCYLDYPCSGDLSERSGPARCLSETVWRHKECSEESLWWCRDWMSYSWAKFLDLGAVSRNTETPWVSTGRVSIQLSWSWSTPELIPYGSTFCTSLSKVSVAYFTSREVLSKRVEAVLGIVRFLTWWALCSGVGGWGAEVAISSAGAGGGHS